jgi:hypothetical protein
MKVTVADAEKIRKHLGDNEYEFSIRIGYSPNAYKFATKAGISPRMAREIWRRYNHLLKES